MGRGDRHLYEPPPGPSPETLTDARTDAHVWVDRAFDAVTGFMQGIGEVIRGAGDIAAGRRPAPTRPGRVSPRARTSYSAPSPETVSDLGEWYMDKAVDAESGRTVYMVTNGERFVECRSETMATEVIAALNEQGVKTRAADHASEASKGTHR